MINAELRYRIKWLLRRDKRTDDFDQLRLTLCNLARGRDPVRETGDFDAHRDECDKRPSTA